MENVENNKMENALLDGTVLKEKYKIIKTIGAGSFGITYLAEDINLERNVAVKEYYLSRYVTRIPEKNSVIVANDKYKELFEERKKRFLSEARILVSMEANKNVVSIFDFFEENNTAYIVMEFIEGKTLEEYVSERGKLSVKESCEIIIAMAESLRSIHEKNIIHRDIKPQNIMISSKGNPVLLDFGSAKDYVEEPDGNTRLVYSADFSPKEQRSIFAPKGPWTDVYALCAVFYFCIVGQRPEDVDDREFNNDSDKHLRETIEKAVGKKDSTLVEIIAKGMAIDVEDRYKNMGEVAADVQGYMKKPSAFRNILYYFNKKKNSFKKNLNKLSRRKKIMYTIFTLILCVSVVFTSLLLWKNRKVDISALEDGQVVYINPIEGKSNKEIIETNNSIKKRMGYLFGPYGYVMNKDSDNNIEIYVPFDNFGNVEPEIILKYFVLRPAKLHLAYDFFNYIELSANAIEKIETKEDNTIFYLTDEMGESISSLKKEWLQKKTKIDGNNIYYEEIKTYEDYYKEPDETRCKDNDELKLIFDYDLIVNDEIGYDTLHYNVLDVSDDGRIITVSRELFDQHNEAIIEDNEGYELFNKIIEYDLYNEHFDNCFETKFNMPTVWETEENQMDNRLVMGKNQKNSDYFIQKNIECVDVMYEQYITDKDTEIDMDDRWITARDRFIHVLDEIGIDYAIGHASYDKRIIIVRLPSETTGECYYSMLSEGIDYKSRLAPYIDTSFDRYFYHEDALSNRDYVHSSGIHYENGKIHIKLKQLNELENERSKECYEAFMDTLKTDKCNGKVAFYIGDSDDNYMTGAIDYSSNYILLEKSTFADDESIPENIYEYIKLYNYMLNKEINSRYYYEKAIPFIVSVEDSINKKVFGLRDKRKEYLKTEIQKKLANSIGIRPEVYLNSNTVCIELLQDIDDNYAENVNQMFKNVVAMSNEILTLAFSSKQGRIVLNLRNFNDENQVDIRINYGEECSSVRICYWDYIIDDDNKECLQQQLLKLKTMIENDPEFDEYEKSIYKYFVSGMRKNLVRYKD